MKQVALEKARNDQIDPLLSQVVEKTIFRPGVDLLCFGKALDAHMLAGQIRYNSGGPSG